jgi:hypothetical protein
VLGRHSDVLLAEEVHRRVGQVLVYLLPALAVIAGVYALVWRRRHRGGPPTEPQE